MTNKFGAYVVRLHCFRTSQRDMLNSYENSACQTARGYGK